MADKSYRIVPAEFHHIARLSDGLRDLDRQEVEATGLSARRVVRRSFQSSMIAKTVFVSDEIAAMWGMHGDAFDDVGVPWLLTTPAIERIPVSFLRHGRAEVGQMLDCKPVLKNFVLASYHRACRFVEVLGFSLGEPVPYGPNNVLFRPFEMRR